MKRINVAGIRWEALEESRRVPAGLNWVGSIPTSYSIHLIKNEDKSKTIVALSDAFGGRVAYAFYDGDIDLQGSETEIDIEEQKFLRSHYPILLSAIESL